MGKENATVNIPSDLLEPIIQSHVSAALAKAFSGQDNLVAKAIEGILSQKVDNNGKPTNYKGQPWIDWAVGDLVRAAVKETLAEELAKHKTELRRQIADGLAKKNSKLVKQLIAGLLNTITSDSFHYRLQVSVD